MPCNCDHMEPNQWEAESKKVAELLSYLLPKITDEPVSGIIHNAATGTYGDRDRVHEFTEILCTELGDLSESELADLVYDGRNPEARRLADWWDAHKAADVIKAEAAERKQSLKETALAKLTPEEREALGL